MTGTATFASWFDTYERVFRDPDSLAETACPNCGARTLRMIFIVRSHEAENGTAVFWCDSCRNGLQPLNAPVARGGERKIRGTETVPDYSFVLDDGLE
ncbi:hypothetical protein ACFC00_38385 [Streptomyces adustus]|uniref:hypothetical protein n=1 Tax=Streptomyces adustus TaxID=1609272 RepID=UPI0035DE685B